MASKEISLDLENVAHALNGPGVVMSYEYLKEIAVTLGLDFDGRTWTVPTPSPADIAFGYLKRTATAFGDLHLKCDELSGSELYVALSELRQDGHAALDYGFGWYRTVSKAERKAAQR